MGVVLHNFVCLGVCAHVLRVCTLHVHNKEGYAEALRPRHPLRCSFPRPLPKAPLGRGLSSAHPPPLSPVPGPLSSAAPPVPRA